MKIAIKDHPSFPWALWESCAARRNTPVENMTDTEIGFVSLHALLVCVECRPVGQSFKAGVWRRILPTASAFLRQLNRNSVAISWNHHGEWSLVLQRPSLYVQGERPTGRCIEMLLDVVQPNPAFVIKASDRPVTIRSQAEGAYKDRLRNLAILVNETDGFIPDLAQIGRVVRPLWALTERVCPPLRAPMMGALVTMLMIEASQGIRSHFQVMMDQAISSDGPEGPVLLHLMASDWMPAAGDARLAG